MTTTPQRSDAVPIRRALLSVSDKSGIVELAKTLAEHGVEIVSTGGTARLLEESGVAVRPVDDLTGFPEMLSGRVKTLHPKVHGGILARRDDADHARQTAEHEIPAIDLVVVNLYPFERTVSRDGATRDECVEQIDIGGPAMVRSAAKNHDGVAVVVDPSRYAEVADEIVGLGGTSAALRRSLAAEAFARTAAYDAVIASYLREPGDLPARLTLTFSQDRVLRYGENPHQRASVYREQTLGAGRGVLDAELVGGKELSYNNLNDAEAAWWLAAAGRGVEDLPVAVVVKHANPCGFASADRVIHAIDRAIEGDPMAAFGGILAVDAVVDAAAASWLVERGGFFEVLIAADISDDATGTLASKWPNLRLLRRPGRARSGSTIKQLVGGLLVQDDDALGGDPSGWTHAAGPEPTSATRRVAAAMEPVIRALSSNAVCLGRAGETGVELVGAGAGQMDRVAACRNAVTKAGERAAGAVAFSDAFFPFDDGPRLLIDAGVTTLVHPGGSKRDADTFDLCDERGVTCLTTGRRHFRH
ncbi:MAG: bifunctional phosphoribosylaminoimidazolecarboxamide formyltransferase/IMP cyclohydrolase [Planctomycetota bacterium]